MILRRVTEHVKSQNWFAVGIDFLIVVVGVFIGIQVANWNAGRIDRSNEQIYLEALVEDVRKDVSDIEVTIAVETARISALDHLIRQATGSSLPDGFDSARGRIDIVSFPPYFDFQSFDVGYTLFIMNSVPSRRAAYETIINAGGLGLIRDTSMVREIQEYYARVGSLDGFGDTMQLTRQRFVESMRQAGISPVDDHSMDGLIERFRDDIDMTTAAKEYWLFTNFHLRLLSGHQKAAGRFVEILESGIEP